MSYHMASNMSHLNAKYGSTFNYYLTFEDKYELGFVEGMSIFMMITPYFLVLLACEQSQWISDNWYIIMKLLVAYHQNIFMEILKINLVGGMNRLNRLVSSTKAHTCDQYLLITHPCCKWNTLGNFRKNV